jgi:hypothetical protein
MHHLFSLKSHCLTGHDRLPILTGTATTGQGRQQTTVQAYAGFFLPGSFCEQKCTRQGLLSSVVQQAGREKPDQFAGFAEIHGRSIDQLRLLFKPC